jgi:hypothetical protein
VFAADPVASVILDIDDTCDVVHRRRGARICVAWSAAFASAGLGDDQPRGPRLPEADLFPRLACRSDAARSRPGARPEHLADPSSAFN